MKLAHISPAQTFQLRELVSYQESSIVSRTLLDRSTGTVTLFAFDEDQGLSPHTTPYDALVQVLEGEVQITISGKPNLVREGELILMPAGQSHAVKAVQRFKMLLTMIHFQEEKGEASDQSVKLTVSN